MNPLGMDRGTPYLSIVVASRNDDHGGDPLIRTQICINNIAMQAEKYRLPAELIIVDWNPVCDRKGLAAVLDVPSWASYLQGRVLTVGGDIHRRLKYSERLPFFQMIAKNAGIRRAKGKFVLATNIDILLSDELVEFISRQKLDPKKQYRVDRYDIEAGLTPDATPEETVAYAWSHPIRTHPRYHPKSLLQDLYGTERFLKHCQPIRNVQRKHEDVQILHEDGVWQVRPERWVDKTYLHTNACGDFALMSRDAWFEIRGYPEFEAFSFNTDSIGMIAAHYAGYEEVSLLPPCVCFHIEHGIGSGWTPEGEKQLFDRLENAGILSPEWHVLDTLVDQMRQGAKVLDFNNDKWGLAKFDLPEQVIGDAAAPDRAVLDNQARQAEIYQVSSINPSYDLDRLTLFHERRYGVCTVDARKVVVYVPGTSGEYSEERTISQQLLPRSAQAMRFHIDCFPPQHCLRFDPCQCEALITIYSIRVLDKNGNSVWEVTADNVTKLSVIGTALRVIRPGWKERLLQHSPITNRKSFYIVSTGNDPQLILPPLPLSTAFPIDLSVKMHVVPN